VRDVPFNEPDDASLKGIDAGEMAAIQLAAYLHADLLLMDDRKGVSAAERKGLRVTGTLGILDLAARRGLIDLPATIDRLRETNFRVVRLRGGGDCCEAERLASAVARGNDCVAPLNLNPPTAASRNAVIPLDSIATRFENMIQGTIKASRFLRSRYSAAACAVPGRAFSGP